MASLRPLALTFFVFGAFWGGWTVAAADIERTFHFSHAGFGLILSAALGGATIVNFLGGALAERHGVATVLAVSLLGWSGCLVAGTFAGGRVAFSLLLLAAVALGGLVDVAMNVAATAALGLWPGRLVRFHAWFNIGAAAGAVFTGMVLALHGNWRWGWLAIAAVAVALSAVVRGHAFATPHDNPPTTPEGDAAGGGLLGLLRRERLLLLATAFAAAAMVEGGIDLWGVLFLRTALGSGLGLGVGSAVIGYVIAAGARVALGPAAGRGGALRGIAVGAGLAAAGMAVTASAPGAILAGAGYVVAAAGIAMCWPLFIARASVGRGRPAAVVGAMSSFGYLGIVIGPAAVGWISGTAGLRTGLAFVAAVALFAALAPLWGAQPGQWRTACVAAPDRE